MHMHVAKTGEHGISGGIEGQKGFDIVPAETCVVDSGRNVAYSGVAEDFSASVKTKHGFPP